MMELLKLKELFKVVDYCRLVVADLCDGLHGVSRRPLNLLLCQQLFRREPVIGDLHVGGSRVKIRISQTD